MWEITCWSATCKETASSGVMPSGKGRPVTSFCSLTQLPAKRGGQSHCPSCLPTLPALAPLWAVLQCDKCHGCGTQRNSSAAAYPLLGTETGVRALKNEVSVDKCFVDSLCVSFHQEGYDPGLDKICMTLVSRFRFLGAWGSSADLICWQLPALHSLTATAP